ncbi:MAG: hypothetical protein HY791_31080 [Deltaproteobacteria bacterium]|nr:hypothetical protein [Deltaproteobacteria bacterium]
MRITRPLLSTLLAPLVLSGAAMAQDLPTEPTEQPSGNEHPSGGGGYPLALVSRPMTLDAGLLQLNGVIPIGHASLGLVSETAIGLSAGVTYGVTDDLTVNAVVLPLQLSPSASYGNPIVGARYRFLPGSTEVGGQVSLIVPIRTGSDFTVGLGVPVRAEFSDAMSLDTGFNLGIVFASTLVTTQSIPVNLHFQATPELAISLDTGLGLSRLDFDTLGIPLGVSALYAIAGGPNAPLVDLGASFGFPIFLAPGSGGDVVVTEFWALGLMVNFYLGTN